MIRVVIIEDEIPARKKLKRLLEEQDTGIVVVAELDRVAPAVAFLQQHQADLIFSDIQLLDGSAFEIYTQVAISCPIIFTTAYDQYWMEAFDTNGIAYLLKPYSKERFQQAWNKYLLLSKAPQQAQQQWSRLAGLMEEQLTGRKFKKRFLVHTHLEMYMLPAEHISFFEANEGVVFAFDTSGKKHIMTESSLREIEAQTDPAEFFRINRSELVSKQQIERIVRHSKNNLAIKMKGTQRMLTTSQGSTSAFRLWIDS